MFLIKIEKEKSESEHKTMKRKEREIHKSRNFDNQ